MRACQGRDPLLETCSALQQPKWNAQEQRRVVLDSMNSGLNQRVGRRECPIQVHYQGDGQSRSCPGVVYGG